MWRARRGTRSDSWPYADRCPGRPDGTVGALLSTVAAVAAILIITAACIQLRPLRRAAYGLDDGHPVAPPATDRAVAQALAARARVVTRPVRLRSAIQPRARLEHLGRPDRPRDDDGGLVDLNSSPTEVLLSVCGLDRDAAERLVAARQGWATGFSVSKRPWPSWTCRSGMQTCCATEAWCCRRDAALPRTAETRECADRNVDPPAISAGSKSRASGRLPRCSRGGMTHLMAADPAVGPAGSLGGAPVRQRPGAFYREGHRLFALSVSQE